jgi:hypothetical protein
MTSVYQKYKFSDELIFLKKFSDLIAPAFSAIYFQKRAIVAEMICL